MDKQNKDTMLRVRVDDDTLNKLDYVVEKQSSDRSKVIRQGIEIQYKKEVRRGGKHGRKHDKSDSLEEKDEERI